MERWIEAMKMTDEELASLARPAKEQPMTRQTPTQKEGVDQIRFLHAKSTAGQIKRRARDKA